MSIFSQASLNIIHMINSSKNWVNLPQSLSIHSSAWFCSFSHSCSKSLPVFLSCQSFSPLLRIISVLLLFFLSALFLSLAPIKFISMQSEHFRNSSCLLILFNNAFASDTVWLVNRNELNEWQIYRMWAHSNYNMTIDKTTIPNSVHVWMKAIKRIDII